MEHGISTAKRVIPEIDLSDAIREINKIEPMTLQPNIPDIIPEDNILVKAARTSAEALLKDAQNTVTEAKNYLDYCTTLGDHMVAEALKATEMGRALKDKITKRTLAVLDGEKEFKK